MTPATIGTAEYRAASPASSLKALVDILLCALAASGDSIFILPLYGPLHKGRIVFNVT